MDTHGLKGVGFLFGLIALFLLVACLKQTGHAAAATASGLAGCAVLALSTGMFLLRRWRTAVDESAFHEDGDVQFALAVFLLVLIAPMIPAIGASPLIAIVLIAAVIPARAFVRSLRHRS